MELTQDELKKRLSYDKETGLFTRIWSRKADLIGEIAGSLTSKGYIIIKTKGISTMAHRIAWLFEYGYWPEFIDHINGIRDDNRIVNLREVSNKENAKNQKKHQNNTSTYSGVYFHKHNKKWIAQINDGKQIYLGSFKDKEDAIKARKEADVKYNYHPNHGRD